MAGIVLAATCTCAPHENPPPPEPTVLGRLVEGEPATFTCIVGVGPFMEDIATNAFTQALEARTNVHIEWEPMPLWGEEARVAARFASGELPDFFLNVSTADMEVRYGSEGKQLVPLESYAMTEMPHLRERLNDRQFQSLFQLDGHLYGLPYIDECYHCTAPDKMWIYEDWLDALGLDMPTTTDDFEAVLRAFRDDDPNGNGIADEVPLAGALRSGWHTMIDKYLLGAFLYYDLDVDPNASIFEAGSGGFYMTTQQRIDTALDKEAYREGLRYINRLYRQQLIYDGTFAMDQQQLIDLVETPGAPIVGAVAGGYGGTFCDVTGDRYGHYITVPSLIGPMGRRNAPTREYLPTNTLWITSRCEDPALVCRWADWLYTTEGTIMARHGIEGVNWRWAQPGEKGIDGKDALWVALTPWSDTQPQNDSWISIGTYADMADIRLGQAVTPGLDARSIEGLEPFLYQETKANYAPYRQFSLAVPPLKFPADRMGELAYLQSTYGRYVKEWNIAFSTGAKSLETDWDAYLRGLEDAGKERVLQLMNDAYRTLYR